MKKQKTLFLVGLIVVAMAALVVAEEKPWFDNQNCEFCKPWMESGLMSVMSHEHYMLANGVMTISTVPAGKIDAYKKASAQMDVLSKKAAAGEKVNMCLSCETMGSFFPRGAKMENVPTKNGSVMLLTAADAAVVADMQKWANRNTEEMKKAAAPAEKKDK